MGAGIAQVSEGSKPSSSNLHFLVTVTMHSYFHNQSLPRN